jgi:hypothetical protein
MEGLLGGKPSMVTPMLLLRDSGNFCQAWCAGRFEGVSKYSFTYSLFILRDAPEQNFRGGESALPFRSSDLPRLLGDASQDDCASLGSEQSLGATGAIYNPTMDPFVQPSAGFLRRHLYSFGVTGSASISAPGVSVAQEISRPTVCANYVQGRGSLNFSLPAAPPRSQNQSDGEASILIAQPAATAPPRAWRLASWPARPTRRQAGRRYGRTRAAAGPHRGGRIFASSRLWCARAACR